MSAICALQRQQMFRVEAQMIFDKAGDKEVAVVITRLNAQGERIAQLLRHRSQPLRPQLVGQELIAVPWSTSIGSTAPPLRISQQLSYCCHVLVSSPGRR